MAALRSQAAARATSQPAVAIRPSGLTVNSTCRPALRAGDEASLLKDGQVLRDRLPGDGQQGRQAARARAGAPGQEFKQLTPARVRERREYAIRVSESFCHNRLP